MIEKISQKGKKITTLDKNPLKCDCVSRSILNGFQNSVLYSFTLVKLSGVKLYSEQETKHFRKINESVFIT